MIDIPDFVYSKDSQGNALCPRCKKLVAQCDCPQYEPVGIKSVFHKPRIYLEKSGRRGKVVTIIQDLVGDESHLKSLAKELKIKTGSGGTFYVTQEGGTIELQGDHQKNVIEFFKTLKA